MSQVVQLPNVDASLVRLSVYGILSSKLTTLSLIQ